MTETRKWLASALVGAAALLAAGVAQAATVSFADAMSLMARDCGKDVQAYCKTASLANNGVGRCLVENQAKVSPTCLTTFAAVTSSLQQRLAAQQEVLKVCRGDAARRCQGVVQNDGYILDCLLEAAGTVSKKCNAAITNAGWR